MNERIQQLAIQAAGKGYQTFGTSDFDNLESIEKFAELIVRECAGIAKQTDADDGDDYKSGRQWAGIEILKHFNVGVEE